MFGSRFFSKAKPFLQTPLYDEGLFILEIIGVLSCFMSVLAEGLLVM